MCADTFEFKPGALSGRIEARASKSELHRALLMGCLCDRPTRLKGVAGTLGDDIVATIGGLGLLNGDVRRDGSDMIVSPATGKTGDVLDCIESGSTLRFMLPLLGTIRNRQEPILCQGQGRLPERPLGELLAVLRANGMEFSKDRLPFQIGGRLRPGIYELPGNISSQYISGLLMALPLLSNNSELRLTTALESSTYVDMTLSIQEQFGVFVQRTGEGWSIPGGQVYRSPGELAIGGDWSNGALWLCRGVLAGEIEVMNLSLSSHQGDKLIVDILRRFGGSLEVTGNGIRAAGSDLHGIEVDVRETPDLLPVLAVVACGCLGETRFVRAGRLRMKESDRLSSTATLLRDLGGDVEEFSDGLLVRGSGSLRGDQCRSFNDHRLVMASCVASAIAQSPVVISGAQAIAKSYPELMEDYALLTD